MRDQIQSVSSSPSDGTSILAVLTTLLRARRVLVRSAFMLVAVTAVVTLLKPRQFSTEAALMPQGGRPASALSGIAAQFGVGLAAGDAAASPAFVAKLLGSPELRRRLASDSLRRADGSMVSVRSLYDIDAASPAALNERVATALGEDIRVANEAETGLVRMRVTARDAALATALAQRLIQLGDSALVARRQRQAAADAQYAAEHLARAKRELQNAESTLQAFLASNRRFVSPRLVMESERLRREQGAREAVVAAMAQSVEQATMEAGRPTPVLSVIEPPEIPALPEPRGLVIRCLFALVGGLVLGACFALFRESIARQSMNQHQLGAAFAEESRDLGDDLRHPWRLVVSTRRKAA